MAGITLASYLETLRGRLGDVVFCNRYGREYARVYVKPANPGTGGQRAIRRTFGDAVRSWQALPQEDKERWDRQARKLPMSGYNLFISRFMKETIPAALVSAAHRKAAGEHLPPYMNASPSVSAPFQLNNRFCPPSLCGRRSPGTG